MIGITRDELTVADYVILKGTRILIPKSLQPAVLLQLQYGHQGAKKGNSFQMVCVLGQHKPPHRGDGQMLRPLPKKSTP